MPIEMRNWDHEKIYADGDVFFNDILSELTNAKVSIKIESYIFEKGLLADRIVSSLKAASARGVAVQLIIDGWGSPDFLFDYYDELISAGIQIRMYRLWPWARKQISGESPNLWVRFWMRLREANRGDHRKLILIDEYVLYTGSYNISDVHLHEVYGNRAWSDLGVRVCGIDVSLVQRAFVSAFRQVWLVDLAKKPKESLVLLNDSMRSRRTTKLSQTKKLKKAQLRIWIQTPYFVPIAPILRILRRKARAGVDVRIMIPRATDVAFMPWVSTTFYERLIRSGVSIYEYSPRFAHQKLFIIDDWMSIGSTNLNHRSFLHDLELDVAITQQENRQFLEHKFLSDQTDSDQLKVDVWQRLTWWKKLLGSLIWYFRYWI